MSPVRVRHRRSGRFVAEEDAVAIHEAAHSVISEVLGVRVAFVGIEDDEDDDDPNAAFPACAFTAASDWLVPFVQEKRAACRVGRARRRFVEAHLQSALAGTIAERIFLKRIDYVFWHPLCDDAHQALVFAAMLGAPRATLRDFAQGYEARTRDLVEQHWGAIEAIARLLLWRREIAGLEVRRLMRQYARPSNPRHRPRRDEHGQYAGKGSKEKNIATHYERALE